MKNRFIKQGLLLILLMGFAPLGAFERMGIKGGVVRGIKKFIANLKPIAIFLFFGKKTFIDDNKSPKSAYEKINNSAKDRICPKKTKSFTHKIKKRSKWKSNENSTYRNKNINNNQKIINKYSNRLLSAITSAHILTSIIFRFILHRFCQKINPKIKFIKG